MSRSDERVVSFDVEKWRLLTELPGQAAPAEANVKKMAPPLVRNTDQHTADSHPQKDVPRTLMGVTPTLAKLLYDLMVYPFSSVTERLKRLGISGRALEKAKLEGCEKGFMLESTAGATIYLIPTPKTFDALGFSCPYDLTSIEHSYYQGLCKFSLEKDPANKSVYTEFKIRDSGSTADLISIAHDGARRAYEVTLSSGNVLSNTTKYTSTDFIQIVFVCRDYQLRQAVKACCHTGGLDPALLAKLDYWQFSTLLRRQPKTSRY